MARYSQNAQWITSFDTKKPYQSVQVCPTDEEMLDIGFWNGGKGYLLAVSRESARLLAKRINQCLDGTPKIRRKK